MPDVATLKLYAEYLTTKPILGLLVLAFSVAIYFLPLIIAALRDMPNAVAISVLNLVAGWTFVGWIVALVWACTEQPSRKSRS
ncbi:MULTISPECIES: superinfection immunity protein [Halomonas]|uniref:Superinfection immunity protein n=1 Tax=Halomonas halophila TaxID=29573 RepID=A0ABQ0U029_9GAMM|nr:MULTISPECIES: superinfection immunity protein [Halomonas]MDR5889656.1 superinfection immunity protein [Halomonas salina]WJY06338.1 superinfection immunity protein [Halomonas halophila]GEK71575.1 hypothetical protein HHA04nite_01190 [Halomonas halophila]